MSTKPTHQRAYQANEIDLRAVKVVDLASQLGTEAFHRVDCFEPLGEFLESLLDDGKKHDSVAALVSCVTAGRADDDSDDDDDALQHAGEILTERNHYGMAVHFGTPVRTYHTDRSWSSGWGHYYILDRAFTGFAALPAPVGGKRDWWTVLGLQASASHSEIREAFNQLARAYHPDRGGTHERMAEIIRARDEALSK